MQGFAGLKGIHGILKQFPDKNLVAAIQTIGKDFQYSVQINLKQGRMHIVAYLLMLLG
jgi:hypothetical protein